MKGKKIDKNKIIAGAVTALLIVFFVGGFLIGLDRVRSMEGTYPEPENPEATMPPESISEALNLLETLIEKAQEGDPKISKNNGFSLDEKTLKTSGSDEFNSTLLFIKDNFTNHITDAAKNKDEKTSTKFGGDISEVLRYPDITVEDIESFSDDMIVFSCLSCGLEVAKDENTPEPPSNCEACGSAREYFEKYKDIFTVDLVLKCEAPFAEGSVLKRNFAPRTNEEIAALTQSVIEGSATVDVNASEDIIYNVLKISFTFNRLKNELLAVRYIKQMSVNADVTFEGDYAVLGSQNISFDLTETVNYNLSWPGVSLSKDELVIEPGKSDNLLVTVHTDDEPNEFNKHIVWKSENESIATVDQDGYIDAGNEPGEVKIIVEYTYLGKTFTDECTVIVRVPVESIKMSQKKAELQVGETITLEAKVSPKKASEKSVRWHSENEAVATVDENGVVTAVAPGEVIIFAVSNDGDFKSTCEVSVK